MGDIIITYFFSVQFTITTLSGLNTFVNKILEINIKKNEIFLPINKNICLCNFEINEFVYNNYLQKSKEIKISFKDFNLKAEKGLLNIDSLRYQNLQILNDKIWVRNNFRLYNMNIVEHYNIIYYNNLKIAYSEYILKYLIKKDNNFLFYKDNKLNYKYLFSRNYLPYKLDRNYLNEII